MPRRRRRAEAWRTAAGLAALTVLGLMTGCRSAGEPSLTYLGSADLDYYVGRATSVATPDVSTLAADNAVSLPPHTIADRSRDAIRDITLTEAIHLALANSEVIRERGQFLSPVNPLLNNPEFAVSIYDPAIQETSPQFGNRGVEAALADFDALWTTQMLWGRDERIQNSLFGFGQEPGQVLQQDTAQFLSRLEKPIATGGTFSVSHLVDYEFANAPNRLFDSAYAGNVQAEFRHPLLAGFGVEFNRIAGPQSRTLGRNVQLNNGVLIARISTDMEIAEFQRAARNLVREVEETYWNLALAYRIYDAEVIARDSVLETWRNIETRRRQGLPGTGAAELAQALESYFDARARVESSLGDLYRRELELRRITGLPVNDGCILRPIDEPHIAPFLPDWYASLCEALTRRTELRRQKWQIKSFELQLAAARNLARPNLDFVSRYRVNGFGDRLLTGSDDDVAGTAEGLDSFYNTLLQGDQTGWDLGFELSMPIGLRSAKSQVRWFELRLMKARAALSIMEHEISHELAAAFQEVDRFYKIAQTNLNRRAAAEERVRAFEAQLELGGIGGESPATGAIYVDQLLRSQISLAQAESAYWQSVMAYNQAIADVHLRQETLLERAGITLAEGSWSPSAYAQALRRAWARSHGFRNPLLDAEPEPFAREGDFLPTGVPQPPIPATPFLPETVVPSPMVPEPFTPEGPTPPPEPEPLVNEDWLEDFFLPAGMTLPDDATPVRRSSSPQGARIIRGINR
jgi:hypothetical protein